MVLVTAREMAVASGLPPRVAYSLHQTADYVGVSYRTVLDEVRAGRLRTLPRPTGGLRGARVRPEDVDEWMDCYGTGGDR